jgi:hypothetical protein
MMWERILLLSETVIQVARKMPATLFLETLSPAVLRFLLGVIFLSAFLEF